MNEEDERYGGDGPKTGIFDSAKSDITPDFLDDDDNQNNKQFYAKSALRASEASASDNPNENGRGGDKDASLGEKEGNVPAESNTDKFKNAVKGAAAAKSGNYLKAASNFKKSGPVMGIVGAIIAFAFMSYAGSSLMPFSLVANLQDSFDTINTISTVRSDKLLMMQMQPNSRTIRYGKYDLNNLVKAKIFQRDKFKISKRQESKLKAKGFDVDDIDGVKVLRFGDQVIVPDAKYTSEIANSIDYKTAISQGGELSTRLTEGTLTWRSSVRYWFDTKVKTLFSKLHLSRNKMRDAKTGDIDELKAHTSQDAEDPDMSKGSISDETDIETETNSDGSETLSPHATAGNTTDLSGLKKGAKLSEIKTKLEGIAKSKASKFSGGVSKAINAGCMLSSIVGSISALMRALNLTQVRSVSMQVLEVTQKAQAGDNVGSSLNTVAGTLSTPATNTYKAGLFQDKESDLYNAEITGSAMQSNGVISAYEKKPREPDASTESLNPFSNLGELASVFNKFGASIESFKTCATLKIATNLGSLVEVGITALDIVLCIATGAGCALVAKDIAIKVGSTVAIQTIISTVVSWLVPKVANFLVKDIATNLMGQEYGNVIAEGAANVMAMNHQSGGGSLATKETLIAYNQYEREVLAEKARYERSTRSPFDPTSKNTFLGSLLTKFGLMANTLSTPVAALSSLGSTAISSLGSFLPHASALEDAEEAEYLAKYTSEHCANLESIGALAADAFCNPKMIEDVTTINTDPAEVYARLDDDDELDCFEDTEGNNPTIKQNSTCMKYIVYYTQRESEFGVADQNIANADGIANDGSVISTLSQSAPGIGEVIDIFNNATALNNVGYITGSVGVTNNNGDSLGNVTRKRVPEWSQAKYIQRYIGDQRLLEGMGIIEESAVTAALRTYYEEHPLDNSFEGILARKTGMTKENVEIALDFIDLATFAKNYEPSDLYPYFAIEKEENKISFKEKAINTDTYFKNTTSNVYVVRNDYYIA